jgi:hypothetical protein
MESHPQFRARWLAVTEVTPKRSNQAMERTPKAFASRLTNRRMTRLKEELEIKKQAKRVDFFISRFSYATLCDLAVYPERFHASVFSSAVAHLVDELMPFVHPSGFAYVTA